MGESLRDTMRGEGMELFCSACGKNFFRPERESWRTRFPFCSSRAGLRVSVVTTWFVVRRSYSYRYDKHHQVPILLQYEYEYEFPYLQQSVTSQV
eukprot:scaffold677933_cov69-Prasinocladus_malaysianus.AAC.1